jgi:hypothetical protein
MDTYRFRSSRAAFSRVVAIGVTVAACGVAGVALAGPASAASTVAAQRAFTRPVDTTPPSVPTNLRVTRSTYPAPTFYVFWDASSDNFGVAHYDVSRDGGTPSAAPYTIFASQPVTNASVTFQVRAVDAAGNRSDWATFTIPAV